MTEKPTPDAARRREAERILAENRRRAAELPPELYSSADPAHLFMRHGQERALLGALRRHDLLPLDDRRILEVGCGTGRWLRFFVSLGAARERLAGLDLDRERLARARPGLLGADLRPGDAADLPWDDGSFDLVFQSTMMSSILDDGMRRTAAAEMLRVLRPGGAVVWYDFFVDNPKNPHVRGVGRRELRSLFPRCRIRRRRVTLLPPLARWLVPRSWAFAAVLESLRVLDTHTLAVLRPFP